MTDSLLPIKGLICDSAKLTIDAQGSSIVWDMGRLELILRRLFSGEPISHDEARELGREIDAELEKRRSKS